MQFENTVRTYKRKDVRCVRSPRQTRVSLGLGTGPFRTLSAATERGRTSTSILTLLVGSLEMNIFSWEKEKSKKKY